MGLLSTIGAASGRAFGLTRVGAAIRDAYFNLTTLLLPGDGTNGAQNNTFLDSSTNNFTITRNGNTTQGTFSPFSQTGWSNNFDGADSSLSLGGQTAFSFGTGDWTIEFWMYFTATGGTLFDTRPAGTVSTNGYSVLFLSSSSVRYDTASGVKITGSTLSANTWYHVALCKASGTTRLFINGVQDGSSYTDSVNYGVGANRPIIGADGNSPTTVEFTGYLSNYRVLKGTGLYATTFTPPTAPLTAITNTSLLTCQSNRFVDNSTNAFAVTANGTPSVQAFSPFAPTAAYSAATVGGSGYFDGTGDYLQSASSTTLQLGSSDFSIEWWEYRDVVGSDDTPVTTGDYAVAYGVMLLGYSGQAGFISTNGSSWNVLASPAYIDTLNAKSWNHFVYTRSGTAFRVFMNGKLSNYATGSGSVTQNNNQFNLGGNTGGGQYSFPGYIAGFRVVKGSIPTDYQTSSTTTGTVVFTPPAAPPTTTSQGATANDVELLLNMTNAAITDATAKNVLETVGNAQISTTQSKWGGSSMSFDGNGDYLFSPQSNNPPNLNVELVRGDFTIEFWFRANTVAPTIQGLIVKFDGDANSRSEIQYMINLGGSSLNCNAYQGVANNDITFTSAISANTWYHVAFVRSGTSVYAYLDGTRNATIRTISGDLNSGTNWPLYIGTYVEGGTGYQFNGFIDDLRITKFARYSGATITVPTAAFPLQ